MLIQYSSVPERSCQETKIHLNHIALITFYAGDKDYLEFFFLVKYQRTNRGEMWSRFALFDVTLNCQ